MNKKITVLRLQKEAESLEKEPHQQALITRSDLLTFHFCLFNLEEDFADGYYHGVLELPEDYPFSPPKIRFFTQNGRFEVGKSICTTFTHYHKETWSSSWNIRTIITALISFMYANEKGIGGIFDSLTRRKNLAKKSLSNNIANPLFVSLFKEKLITRKLISQENFQQLERKQKQLQQKIKKQKQENFTSSEGRDDDQESIAHKLANSILININEDFSIKGSQRQIIDQQNQQVIQPKKHKGPFLEKIPELERAKTVQQNDPQL